MKDSFHELVLLHISKRDKSNAKKYLEEAVKLAAEQEPKLIEAIKKEDKP